MDVSTFSFRAAQILVAAAILSVPSSRVASAAPPAGPSPDEVAYQKDLAALKSGDAAQVAKVEEAIGKDAKEGKASQADVRVLDDEQSGDGNNHGEHSLFRPPWPVEDKNEGAPMKKYSRPLLQFLQPGASHEEKNIRPGEEKPTRRS